MKQGSSFLKNINSASLFFGVLSLLMFLLSISIWGAVDFINLFTLHLAVSHSAIGLIVALWFLIVSWGYRLQGARGLQMRTKAIRRHKLLSILGLLGTLPLLVWGRKIEMPITDLIQYASDMQLNDRLMLICFGMWLITLIAQLPFILSATKLAFRKPTS